MILNYFPTHEKNYDFKREPIKEKKNCIRCLPYAYQPTSADVKDGVGNCLVSSSSSVKQSADLGS